MTDEELKKAIIKKYFVPSFIISLDFYEPLSKCMEEWAGVISKRIDEEDAEDDKNGSYFNDKYGL